MALSAPNFRSSFSAYLSQMPLLIALCTSAKLPWLFRKLCFPWCRAPTELKILLLSFTSDALLKIRFCFELWFTVTHRNFKLLKEASLSWTLSNISKLWLLMQCCWIESEWAATDPNFSLALLCPGCGILSNSFISAVLVSSWKKETNGCDSIL